MSIPEMFFSERDTSAGSGAGNRPGTRDGELLIMSLTGCGGNRETPSPEDPYFPGAQREAACSSDSSHLRAPRVNSAPHCSNLSCSFKIKFSQDRRSSHLREEIMSLALQVS